MHVVSFLPNVTEYRRLFDAFPLELYRNEVYVDYSPFFITSKMEEVMLFMVMDGEKVYARVAALVDPYFHYNIERVGLFGFFDSVESLEVVELLMKSATHWLEKVGCSYVLGPVNCSLWFASAFSEKLSDPFFTDRFNKPYYTDLFTLMGFNEIANFTSTLLSMKNVHSDSRLIKTKERFEEMGILVNEYDAAKMEQELSRIHAFLMEAFKGEEFYTPVTFLEFKSLSGKVIPYLNKSFVLCAEHYGEIVGFVLAYPDLYCKSENRIVLKIVAVKRGRAYAGLGVYLTKQLHYRAKALDCDSVIHAQMNNLAPVTNILDEHTSIIQQYALYGKRI